VTEPGPVASPPRPEVGSVGRCVSRDPRPATGRGRPGAWVLLAAFGPCGFSPVAPGTAGTLAAIPLAFGLSRLGWPAYLGATALLFVLGAVAAARAGRHWGVIDASRIVIDEVVGYLIAVALVPFSWPAALLGAAFFRLFDIWKPWPVSALDRIESGLGVMLDDVVAAVFAWVALRVLSRALAAGLGCGGGPWFCAGLFG